MERTGILTIASSLQECVLGLPEVPRYGAAKGAVMRGRWFARLFFAVVAAFAVAGVMAGTACTRWGQPGPTVPVVGQISMLFVDAKNGSDTTGNGSSTKPYKTLTKTVEVLTTAKNLNPMGVTITLESGDYNAANGEKFPIVISTDKVTIMGSNYQLGLKAGSFIDGFGEDTLFEKLVHAPPHSAYATLETDSPSISVSDVFVGASTISLPGSHATYASLDNLGIMSATASFGAGIASRMPNISGVLDAGGSFTCTSCQISGNDFAIGALTVPIATASPNAVTPIVTLEHQGGDAVVSAKIVGILTDGSIDVTAEGQSFQGGQYAYADALEPIVAVLTRGAIDFGGGAGGSTGGNTFIGAKTSEIYVTRRSETVSALDDIWNPSQQGANRFSRYPRMKVFSEGAAGRNVTIRHSAIGSTVTVGPAPVPTPSPSGSPSTSPTATATSN
jgi:Protein of unknown function (DUF1565)